MYLLRNAVYAAVALSAAQVYGICLAKEPDYRTPPGVIDPAMVWQGPEGKDYQFYYGSYALLIGESNYDAKSGLLPLNNIPKELKDLARVLERQGFEVTTYVDLDSKELPLTIEAFIREYGYEHPESRLVIYFSGHGATREYEIMPPGGPAIYRERKGYVLPIDTVKPNGPEFLKHALPLSQFGEWARAIEVKHALFLFDSCFSGAILNATKGSPSIKEIRNVPSKPRVTVTSDEVQYPLRQFIAAGTDTQEVPATSKFLQILVEALDGRRPEADTNRDEYLTSGELFQYLRGIVPQESVRQTPVEGSLPGFSRGDMVFRLPGRQTVVSAPEPAPEPTEVNLRSIFVGTSVDGGFTVAQAYQADITLNVGAVGCFRNCQDVPVRRYTLTLTMPDKLPATAVFANPVLSCAGSCENSNVVKEPTGSGGHRMIVTEIEAGGQPSTWRLAADVKIPSPAGQAVVLDVANNIVANVELSSLRTIEKLSDP